MKKILVLLLTVFLSIGLFASTDYVEWKGQKILTTGNEASGHTVKVALTDGNGTAIESVDGALRTESIIRDPAGRTNIVGVFGEQWATDVKNDVLAQFTYGKSDYDLKPDETVGSGTVTIQNDNLLTVGTGTDANGSAKIESFNAVRYRPGHTILSHFTALWTNPTADNCDQWIGIADGTNGFTVGFQDGNFTITRIRDSVHYHTDVSQFNGNIDMSTVDFTKLNVFRIMFGYLGSAFITFEMLEPGTNQFNLIHTIEYHNKYEETHIQLPFLPIAMSVTNTGSTEDAQIRSGSWQGGVMGLCDTCANRGFTYPYEPGTTPIKSVGTTPAILAGFKSVSTFNGIANKIRAELLKFTYLPFDATSDTMVTLQLVRGATITGGTYIDIDSNNSTIQVNETPTGFSGGRVGLTLATMATTGQGNTPPQSTPANLDADTLQLFLDPGTEYGIIAFTQEGNVSITWNVNWVELF
jgi:hypothetical protein